MGRAGKFNRCLYGIVSWLAVSLSLLARPHFSAAQGVQRVWDDSGPDIQTLFAASDDALDARGALSTAPCKSGTATPATCSVGQCFFDTDATAGLNTFGCTATNTWTLQSLDGSLYVLRAGRSGTNNDFTISTSTEGTFYGGDSSGDDLRARANSNSAATGNIFLDSQVDVWESQPNATAGAAVHGLLYRPDFVMTGTGTTAAGLVVAPTVHLGSAGLTGASIAALASLGYFLTDDATAAVSNSQILLFNAAHYNATGVNQNPMSQVTLNDIAFTSNDGTGNRTQALYISHYDDSTFQTSSSGTFTRTNHQSFRSSPNVTSNGAVATTIATRRGFWAEDVSKTGAGAAVGTNVGVEIDAFTSGTTNIGLRNADSTVLTPTAQAIGADTDTIAPAASIVALSNTSGANRNLTSNPQVADGVDGQVLTLIAVSATNTIQLDDGNGLQLAGGTSFVMGTNDAITLAYSSTINDWVEVGFRSDN